MSIENSSEYGSMFGVVDNMRKMTQAMEDLLRHLPENFVWPTYVKVSPFSVYFEWGRENTNDEMEESVWLIANEDGVRANANFRPDWPGCGAIKFDAQSVSEWLQKLTRNWEWDASRSGGNISSSLSRKSINKGSGTTP